MKKFASATITAFAVFLANSVVNLAFAAETHATNSHAIQTTAQSLGEMLPLWSIIPFVGILLSIALCPLFAPKFWHHHYAKISAFWALALAIPFLIVFKGQALHEILHIYILDYIPFILLLWSLFTIAGGIHIKGTMKGSPVVNTFILFIGTIIASWIGTTGASMLLIRPIIKSNSWRKKNVHTIAFFIFLVSNIGGALTPLGDPPLFLGFLHGVDFFWTLKHLLLPMGTTSLILLVIYFFLDSYYYKKETKIELKEEEKEPLKIEGSLNFIFLLGVICATLTSGGILFPSLSGKAVSIFGVHQIVSNLVKDGILILMAALSLAFTRKEIRTENQFSWFPIKEVAYLFAGIFMTIIPALAILKAGTDGAMSGLVTFVEKPIQYFWVTGVLSSFLDNAPTYLTFFNTALGKFYAGMPESEAVKLLMTEKSIYLEAISGGAVFMGALTYIGNAPNLMVRSIAEEAGIKMPSFFGYMFKYSFLFLVPVFIIVSLIFLV